MRNDHLPFLSTKLVFGLGFVALLLSAAGMRADIIQYQFNTVFGANSEAPTGTNGPWMTATFQDATNGVLLTISNSDLVGSEKIDMVDFNLNTNRAPSSLTFTHESSVGAFDLPSVSGVSNNFKADGDGYYDVQFSFTTGGAPSSQFGAGESVTYLIAGISGLTAADFEYESFEDSTSSNGPYYAAAHIQNTGVNQNKSAWTEPGDGPILVPEPSLAALLCLGAGAWLRKRSTRAGL